MLLHFVVGLLVFIQLVTLGFWRCAFAVWFAGLFAFTLGFPRFVFFGVEIFALAFGDGLLLFFFSRCVFVFANGFPRWVSAFGFSVGLLSFGFWRALGFWVWAF